MSNMRLMQGSQGSLNSEKGENMETHQVKWNLNISNPIYIYFEKHARFDESRMNHELQSPVSHVGAPPHYLSKSCTFCPGQIEANCERGVWWKHTPKKFWYFRLLWSVYMYQCVHINSCWETWVPHLSGFWFYAVHFHWDKAILNYLS